MAKVYLAGDMLNRGAQLQRAEESEYVRSQGHELYNPMENKEINDKANAVQDGLAERIVSHDTKAINWSDTVIIEPLTHAVGTCIELGQIKGMRDVAMQISTLWESREDINDVHDWYDAVMELCSKHINRKVLPHYEDVRRLQDAPQSGDRREFGLHQYIYGVCLDLTNGKGMYTWDEIKEELRVQ